MDRTHDLGPHGRALGDDTVDTHELAQVGRQQAARVHIVMAEIALKADLELHILRGLNLFAAVQSVVAEHELFAIQTVSAHIIASAVWSSSPPSQQLRTAGRTPSAGVECYIDDKHTSIHHSSQVTGP